MRAAKSAPPSARAGCHGITIGKSHLSHIETRSAKPSLDTVAALAKALDLPVDAPIA